MTKEQFEQGRRHLIDEAQRDGGFKCACCGTWSHFIAAAGRYESHTPEQPGVVYLVCSDCTEPNDEQLANMERRFLADENWLRLSSPEGALS